MMSERRELGRDEAAQVIGKPLELVAGDGSTKAAVNFLKQVEADSGLLIERESQEYGFAHLSVQEYLASVHILEERLESKLVAWIDDSWWHETIRLYSAQTDASGIVAACLETDPPPVPILLLALECQEEARELRADLREKLNRVLADGVEDADPERRRIIAEVLLARRMRRMVRVDEDVYIDPTYVTHAEYQLFLDEQRQVGNYYQPDHWLAYQFPKGQGLLPVVGVRPTDAEAFCQWLVAQGQQLALSTSPDRGTESPKFS